MREQQHTPFRKKRDKPLPQGFSTNDLGLVVPRSDRSEQQQGEPSPDMQEVLQAILLGNQSPGHLASVTQAAITKTELGLFVPQLKTVPRPQELLRAQRGLVDVNDYEVDPQTLKQPEKATALPWAEVAALTENPLVFLRDHLQKLYENFGEPGLTRAREYFDYFVRLIEFNEKLKQRITQLSEGKDFQATISLEGMDKLELLPKLVSDVIKNNVFSLSSTGSLLTKISSILNEAKETELHWEFWAIRKTHAYFSRLENHFFEISNETLEILGESFTKLIAEQRLPPTALRALCIYWSRFIHDMRTKSRYTTQLEGTAALAEQVAETLLTSLGESEATKESRYALYDILLHLDLAGLHYTTKDKLCRFLERVGDTRHQLSVMLTLNLSETASGNSEHISEQTELRTKLLDQLTKNPTELFADYATLSEQATRLVLPSPLGEAGAAHRGKVGYEIEFYKNWEDSAIDIPDGLEVRPDLGDVHELKPEQNALFLRTDYVQRIAQAGLWLEDMIDPARNQSALHIHLDKATHSPDNDLYMGGVFRGVVDRKYHPTTEMRNIPLPIEGKQLQVWAVITLIELLCSKQDATHCGPIELPQFNQARHEEAFFSQITLEQLLFSYICTLTPKPETRLAALLLSQDKNLVKQLVTTKFAPFFTFGFSTEVLEKIPTGRLDATIVSNWHEAETNLMDVLHQYLRLQAGPEAFFSLVQHLPLEKLDELVEQLYSGTYRNFYIDLKTETKFLQFIKQRFGMEKVLSLAPKIFLTDVVDIDTQTAYVKVLASSPEPESRQVLERCFDSLLEEDDDDDMYGIVLRALFEHPLNTSAQLVTLVERITDSASQLCAFEQLASICSDQTVAALILLAQDDSNELRQARARLALRSAVDAVQETVASSKKLLETVRDYAETALKACGINDKNCSDYAYLYVKGNEEWNDYGIRELAPKNMPKVLELLFTVARTNEELLLLIYHTLGENAATVIDLGDDSASTVILSMLEPDLATKARETKKLPIIHLLCSLARQPHISERHKKNALMELIPNLHADPEVAKTFRMFFTSQDPAIHSLLLSHLDFYVADPTRYFTPAELETFFERVEYVGGATRRKFHIPRIREKVAAITASRF